MSIEMKAEGRVRPYDPFGDAKEETPARDWSKANIPAERDRLFEEGSDFQPTQRDEIVGIDNVLIEIDQIIHWLRHSDDYKKHKSRLEPGVIFEGEPGTGKTLVSRYIATESHALFVNVRDFAHSDSVYTDADIRDLFRRARNEYEKRQSPIVLFWDEFESAALDRTSIGPQQASAVSQLTAELDGIHGKNEGILLIGCTNYIHNVDVALRRAGRMGLQIEFNAPDREGKRRLLDHYLTTVVPKKSRPKTLDLETLAYFFDSADTAADIEEAVVESWRAAVRRSINEGKAPVITEPDIVEVFLKRLVGPPTSFISLPEETRLRIAIHEAGHAIAALIYGVPLRLITVQPGKKSLGRVITAEVDEHIATLDEMMSQIRVGIGSIVAEQVADIPANTGTAGDTASISTMAARLVDRMYAGHRTGLINPIALADSRTGRTDMQPSISTDVIDNSDLDIKDIIESIYRSTSGAMHNVGKDNLIKIAKVVNRDITLTGKQFEDLFLEVTGKEAKLFA